MNNGLPESYQSVRSYSPDFYFSALLAPRDDQAALMALYAFNAELSRIRDIISDPMPGEIRIQWWRDVLTGEGAREQAQHPLAAELLQLVGQGRLSPGALEKLIDARIFDLYDDPVTDMPELERYCTDTWSVLFSEAARILTGADQDENEALFRHGGIAYGITAILWTYPFWAARRQMYFPGDALKASGVDVEGLHNGALPGNLLDVWTGLLNLADRHLKIFRTLSAIAEKEKRLAARPVALCPYYLRMMKSGPQNPAFFKTLRLSQIRRQWILWRGI